MEYLLKKAPGLVLQKDKISSTVASLLSHALDTNPRTFKTNDRLPYGYHFTLFPSITTEKELSPDGYTTEHAPLAPYLHRVWASGSIEWKSPPLKIDDEVSQSSYIKNIQSRGSDEKIFVELEKLISHQGSSKVSVKETRTLAYLKDLSFRQSSSLHSFAAYNPPCDVSEAFFPSRTSLFRYSALTYNAHKIHLDKEYAQKVELLQDCLVHGPLTCTLLLSMAQRHLQGAVFKRLSYRAISPLFVEKPIQLSLKRVSDTSFSLWAVDKEESRLAMKATLEVY
jgi:3-methylfumaryl-CoA hydratase